MTDSDDERITRWVREGLLAPEDANRIVAFESRRGSERSAPGGFEPLTTLEVVTYLGLTLGLGGIAGMLGAASSSPHGPMWFAAFAVPALLFLAVGAGLRTSTSDRRRRAGAMAWLYATVCVAAATGVAVDALDIPDDTAGLLGTASVAAIAACLWVFSRRAPQTVAAGIAGGAVVLALPNMAGLGELESDGLGLVLLALPAIVLGEAGMVRPLMAVRACVIASAVIGCTLLVFASPPAAFAALAMPMLLVAVGTWRSSIGYLVTGGICLFLDSSAVVEREVGSPVAAPLAMLLCSLVIVGAVLVSLRIRKDRSAGAFAGGGPA